MKISEFQKVPDPFASLAPGIALFPCFTTPSMSSTTPIPTVQQTRRIVDRSLLSITRVMWGWFFLRTSCQHQTIRLQVTCLGALHESFFMNTGTRQCGAQKIHPPRTSTVNHKNLDVQFPLEKHEQQEHGTSTRDDSWHISQVPPTLSTTACCVFACTCTSAAAPAELEGWAETCSKSVDQQGSANLGKSKWIRPTPRNSWRGTLQVLISQGLELNALEQRPVK